MSDACPLCNNISSLFHEETNCIYYQCGTCFGIFVEKSALPTIEAEQAHYEKHNNDIEDKGYQNFVSPITKSILQDYTKEHIGLDFGAGTGPVISKVLSDREYTIKQYDPYFHKYPDLLKNKYDYIASCEVIEHFYDPYKEFTLLKNLLKPNGKLYCMTHIYDENIPFANWYYKNDPTHVFIYHKNTFAWIQKEFGFSDIIINDRLITLSA